jgi:hypothetical protein
MAAIALANGLNVQMLRKWVMDAEHLSPVLTDSHIGQVLRAFPAEQGLGSVVGSRALRAAACSR